MRHLKLLSILYLFPGFYLFAMHIGFYREIAANSGFPFGAGICTLIAFAFWATAGIVLYPFKAKRSAPTIATLLAFLYPAGIISILCAKLFTSHETGITFLMLQAMTITASLPLGILTGMIIRFFSRAMLSKGVKADAFFFATGYFLGGFVIYPSVVFQILMQPSLLTIQGILLTLPLLMMAFSMPFTLYRRIRLLFTAISACIAGFVLFQLDQSFTNWMWPHKYNGAVLLKSYQTQSGRLTLLLQKETANPDRIIIIRNNHLLCKIASNASAAPGIALPLALEPDKLKLQVLIVSHPFTPLPAAMSSLPFVRHVTLLSPDYEMNRLAQKYRVLPFQNDRLTIAAEFLPRFLKTNKHKFDIVWFIPGAEKELTVLPEIITELKKQMNPDGILTVPALTVQAEKLKNTLQANFPYSVPLPGNRKYSCYGGKNLTSDIRTLENRLEKFQRTEGVILFPRGAFSVLYELNQLPNVKPEFKQNIARKLPAIISLTSEFSKLGIPAFIVAALTGLFYIIARFMVCRKNSFSKHAGLFENGFATAGFAVLLFSATFSSRALAYSSFGFLLASVSCTAFGLLLADKIKSGRFTVILSILLLLLVYPVHDFGLDRLALIAVLANFICSGIIIAKIINTPGHFSNSLLATNYLGYLTGAVLLFVLIFFQFELYVLCFVIILSRIPVMMSRLVLGRELKE
ncbi:hypothetical protein P0136_03900 [Lentisphaerota bacterium ZTH]|nr:hypothetical protein JYG24_04985 [Lentisphaerota bacterium]WET07140.1 hypothetical protein P0136_03900 [Lentisphaerota bacterium ZTH]